MLSFLVSAISFGIVYLYGCIGEIITEKSGHLNLGTPGIIALGGLGSAIGVNIAYSLFANPPYIALILIAILFTCLFAALGGLIYAVLTVTLKANQNVTGLILTTFGVGLMKFIGGTISVDKFVDASNKISKLFVGYEKLGWFGELFLSHGLLVYLAIIIAIVTTIVLKRTQVGLFLRSIGESPATADAQGINVSLYKYSAILIGSAISGLGGLYYVMDRSGGMTFVDAPLEAFGWLSVALVIFSTWRPLVGVFGSILFGGLYILPTKLNISMVQIKLFNMFPYLITILVLIAISIIGSKSSQPPASLGINYFREER